MKLQVRSKNVRIIIECFIIISFFLLYLFSYKFLSLRKQEADAWFTRTERECKELCVSSICKAKEDALTEAEQNMKYYYECSDFFRQQNISLIRVRDDEDFYKDDACGQEIKRYERLEKERYGCYKLEEYQKTRQACSTCWETVKPFTEKMESYDYNHPGYSLMWVFSVVAILLGLIMFFYTNFFNSSVILLGFGGFLLAGNILFFLFISWITSLNIRF